MLVLDDPLTDFDRRNGVGKRMISPVRLVGSAGRMERPRRLPDDGKVGSFLNKSGILLQRLGTVSDSAESQQMQKSKP